MTRYILNFTSSLKKTLPRLFKTWAKTSGLSETALYNKSWLIKRVWMIPALARVVPLGVGTGLLDTGLFTEGAGSCSCSTDGLYLAGCSTLFRRETSPPPKASSADPEKPTSTFLVFSRWGNVTSSYTTYSGSAFPTSTCSTGVLDDDEKLLSVTTGSTIGFKQGHKSTLWYLLLGPSRGSTIYVVPCTSLIRYTVWAHASWTLFLPAGRWRKCTVWPTHTVGQ